MWLYAVGVFLGAYLLFQVQPLVGRMILPWFGGSAAVWTTCLLFFQTVLLAGYLLAHLCVRKLSPRGQAAAYLALLAAGVVTLPLRPWDALKPAASTNPTLRILLLLLTIVGPAYLALSMSGPLLQAWFATLRQAGPNAHPKSTPYRLYAVSNAGSLLGLLAYPTLVEPVLSTRWQSLLWSAGYILLVVVAAAMARRLWSLSLATTNKGNASDEEDPVEQPHWTDRTIWVGLAGCSTALLMAVTAHVTQDIAPLPLLWVLPLGLYLLSFVVCFAPARWEWSASFAPMPALAVVGMLIGLSRRSYTLGAPTLVGLFLISQFVLNVMCHGELARRRPHARHLTEYYALISLGGALGGVATTLLAPALLRGYYELHIALGLCVALCAPIMYIPRLRSVIHPSAIAVIWLATIACLWLRAQVQANQAMCRFQARSFYSAVQVLDAPATSGKRKLRQLSHGTTMHGAQFLQAPLRGEPTTYFGRNSGVGLAMRMIQRRGPVRAGLIGLGVGTLAAYGRPGDSLRFFEIDPLILRVAQTQFSYLHDSRASTDVVIGDARLSLAREAPCAFDIIVLDAFSSDAIPMHLLTREAFQLYFSRLRPGGVLAVHTSNRYVNLVPVACALARNLNAGAAVVVNEDEPRTFTSMAVWVLTAPDPATLRDPLITKVARKPEIKPGLRPWTDDYSSIYSVLF